MKLYPITAALSPNTEADDVWLAFKIIFEPWEWRGGQMVRDVESWFRNYFPMSEAVSFNSGRSAMLALLTAFGVGSGDEVLVQAFTCVAVPNSVLWAGAKPIYIDIDDKLNMNPADAEKKITKKTKAIIVQHTFGVPAQMEKLIALAKKYHLILIEDCAHALGGTFKGKKLGTFGDAAFFSFGRDKVISSVFGGMAIINSNLKTQISRLKEYHNQLPTPSYFWIFQQLLHPIAFLIILATYNFYIGKIVLVFLQKFRLLSIPVYPEEKKGKQPNNFPAKFPNALAILLRNQLEKIDRYNENRKQIAEFYRNSLRKNKFCFVSHIEGAVYLRFPLKSEHPTQIIKDSRHQGIYLGNWYHNIIDPRGVDFEAVKYAPGSCMNAEQAARQIINLPTRISLSQAEGVARSLV